ncbi:pilus assembly protein [Superficieibacter electus]|uniref:Pilus assembly protein n=1 Tax=Superficieibacter electus TaxID=2022662 RepID=A0A2P5GW53_9ENTR|nr:fimbrial protein [Superficieibacter electus]POP47770.1 pilus assembly protein [Superficieibacter electus]POP50783.1 pilus assembly protein [Superficieibacter electus]
MKRNVILAIVLWWGMNMAWASCQLTNASLNHTGTITVDSMFPVTGQDTQNVPATFSGIKCSTENDTISYIPLATSKQVGPFSNGEILKITVTVPRTSEKIGTKNITEKTINYSVKIEHDSYDPSGTGSASVTVPGVMAANTGGNSNFIINLVLVFCKTVGWSGCVDNINKTLKGDTYIENLTIHYNAKKTTCKANNLTIKLPDIALSELPASGKATAKSTTDNIELQCDNLFGSREQTSRKMAVYLSSSDLVTGSSAILKGGANNGVGFVLEHNNKTVNISSVEGSSASADTLWSINKAGAISHAQVKIPLTASYYVYDKNKVQPGALKATALIHVKYD